MSDWIEHRRPDGERVGWMRPEGEGFVPVDLLGRDRAEALDWLAAEELLDSLGIGYLADPYLLDRGDRHPLRVRILEVSTRGIRVKRDDFGAIDVPLEAFDLAWPLPAELTPLGDRPPTGADWGATAGPAGAVAIRDYRDGDAADTLRIFERAILETARAGYTDAQLRAWLGGPRQLDAWAAERRAVTTLVAVDDADRPIGFTDVDGTGYVDRLFVDPDHGRRGVADALLRRVIAVGGERGARELTTHASIVARPVFARAGFDVVHEEEVERGGQTLIRYAMRRPLAQPGSD